MENEIVDVQQQLEPIVRKFELAIFNEDLNDDGNIQLKQEHFDQPLIVGVKYNKELLEKINVYKQCGQIAKVVREIDPPPRDKIDEYNSIFFGKKLVVNKQLPNIEHKIKESSSTSQSYKAQVANVQPNNKVKYFKIGDIDIKDDNGKIYQKQWMKLSDIESSNFRIINDKNNSIVNLNGKHIEMKKWVLVEATTDATTSLEENLNGCE